MNVMMRIGEAARPQPVGTLALHVCWRVAGFRAVSALLVREHTHLDACHPRQRRVFPLAAE